MSLFTLGSAKAVLVVALVYSFLQFWMSLMWSWHWSPLTHTSLSLSPSDGLASFLKTTLANGVKVVKKVITSKFRFHLIHVAIYALECFRNFNYTSPVRLVKEWILMLLIRKQLTWKLFIYIDIRCLFFIKKCHKICGPPLCHLCQSFQAL